MIWPWSTERIYCANEKELGNLLHWLSEQSLAYLGKDGYSVTAVLASPLELQVLKNDVKLKGFYVDVPARYIQARRDKLEPTLAIIDILEGSA